MSLEKWKNHLVCYHCGGYCVSRAPQDPFAEDHDRKNPFERCPALMRYKFKTYAARGRISVARSIQWNNVPMDKDIANQAFTCTTCGVCDAGYCAMPEVKTEIYQAVREEAVKKGYGPPEGSKIVNQSIIKNSNWFGENKKNRSQWAVGLDLPEKSEVLLYAGCAYSYRFQKEIIDLVNILKDANIDIAYLGEKEVCCGNHPYWSGEAKITKTWGKKNLKQIEESGAKTVVFPCALCYHTFKVEYPKLINSISFKMMHVTEFLFQLIMDGKLKYKNSLSKTLTYHDPCRLGRLMGIYDEPRAVLSNIPGIKLVEMERYGKWAWCCGSGASVVKASLPEFSKWTANKRLNEAKQVSDDLVTACPWCRDNLNYTEGNVVIHDLIDLVAQAMT